MSASGTALRGGNAKQQMVAAYNGTGGPASLCEMAVNGRYPFVAGATSEVPMDDFARMFAPGGLLDGYFNTQLRPYVDTCGKVWKLQPVDGVVAPVTPDDLAQFQRAAAIRDLFFAGGGTRLWCASTLHRSIWMPGRSRRRWTWTAPRSFRSTGRRRRRRSPGRGRTDAAGAAGIRSAAVGWSGGTAGNRTVGDVPDVRSRAMEAGGFAGEVHADVSSGRPRGGVRIRAGSVLNPFAAGMLQAFKCPVVQ